MGDAAKIAAKRVRKQKTDRRDARVADDPASDTGSFQSLRSIA